ncbi:MULTISPECIES: NAD(P)/FAD-dependent oxidoreductase [Rhodococcus]|uniref:NAD(P)/FAD-dependent oxidoreductase n=1 Tax=Rhodococcus oxybenzonivorans TaxID=1990687 RepID=A0AAE4V002_9NOCA|nr:MULTISPECIES: NAD(P)/FAD-dependent oxidoreductase [Rhodococcus]MDV7240553.1 NAD(P)/FAD-dependent oxidoreductase [Rhodococcus oxybenzonivorans]MDV7265752.1 NAD(P)/FAD-dependent oxidoreductase [Rhodococcus oxybenzonivorans]MDV7272826.1 NAD(P)/FAD-dependent oxidoreductase [Rhodococcus oxybenzonivorans]MDV7333435.1 NAD(P)/FAD-dependent oxidoreductase [Rhodococcus oxybenzonivorans]MDV7342602.1 NAD(P)/FAD-dependent oxidoreductase [Rhodococcus oxybenzonivorans]
MSTDARDHLVPIDVQPWLDDFIRVLDEYDAELFADLFSEDATWRDNLSFTWTLQQVHGREAFEKLLLSRLADTSPADLTITDRFHSPGEVISSGRTLLEFMFEYRTSVGRGLGVVWATPDQYSRYGFRAYHLFTKLEELANHPPAPPFPRGHGFTKTTPKQNWLENRNARQKFDDRDPEVLIVGGGHGGMMLAAHLDRLGVENLIIERNARVGDNWRNRYHNLALHNPIEMNHFPFVPFPPTFPQYIPKDKLANFLEYYADSLDLKMWLATSFIGAEWNPSDERWAARISRADGTERVLRPKHVVLATGGIGGLPNIPDLPGLASFEGVVEHSSTFNGAAGWAGKRAVVVGAATSAHDVAQDFAENGCPVTMLQRGPITVANVSTANLAYGDYDLGYDPELVDLRFFAGLGHPRSAGDMRAFQKMGNELDADLHAQLRAAGFEMDDGDDGTGWLGKFLNRGGGYYLNVGASEMVASGAIGVTQYRDVETFVPEGVRLRDGSILEADVVVLATGYQNRAAELGLWFDKEIASRFDIIGTPLVDGEFAHAWVPTPQPGLWFMLAGIQTARPNVPFLAMSIKADIEGLLPKWTRETSDLAGEPVR